jgi:hypothetical protein
LITTWKGATHKLVAQPHPASPTVTKILRNLKNPDSIVPSLRVLRSDLRRDHAYCDKQGEEGSQFEPKLAAWAMREDSDGDAQVSDLDLDSPDWVPFAHVSGSIQEKNFKDLTVGSTQDPTYVSTLRSIQSTTQKNAEFFGLWPRLSIFDYLTEDDYDQLAWTYASLQPRLQDRVLIVSLSHSPRSKPHRLKDFILEIGSLSSHVLLHG